MNYEFDYYGEWRKPQLILCKPNRKRIAILEQAIERKLNLNYTSVSELTFTIPYMVDGIKTDGYDKLVHLKKIYLDTFDMWFIVNEANVVGNGIYEKKEIVCYSLESALVNKGFFLPSGVYQLYNPVSPENTILGMVLAELPNWQMGDFDSELYNLWRSFDDTEEDIYSFLTSTIADAYGCIFNFSSVDGSINTYDATKTPQSSDILLSLTNLIKDYQIKSLNEDFATALNITGGNVDLTGINVDGTNIIYNLDSILTIDYLEQETIDAWKSFQAKRKNANTENVTLLAQLRTSQAELLTLQSQAPAYEVVFTNNTSSLLPSLNNASGLTELESAYNQLDGIKKVRMENVPPLPFSDVNSLMNSVSSMINTRKTQIANKQAQIESIKEQRTALGKTLIWSDNFTEDQIKELDELIIIKDWTDQSFIVTDNMTDVERQDVAQTLYDFATLNLERISQKRYQFEIDSVNFVALQEYEAFTGRLNIGQKFWLDIRDDYRIQPTLLGIEFNFDDDTDFVLKFSNKTTFQEEAWSASDWTNESAKISNSVAKSLANIKELERSKDDVSDFIKGNLVAANNMVINAANQEVTFDEFGIRLRQKDNITGQYKPQATWIMNNIIALSDDNFQTSKIAIGMIRQADGSYINAVNADVLAGRIIAGNQLILSNENNSFTVDGTGLTAENANMYFIRGNNKIEINPTDGIILTKNGTETVKLSLQDGSGHFIDGYFSGTISGSAFTGGSINIGNGRFTVNSSGDVYMRYADIYGGSLRLGNTTITESKLNAIGAYLDSTSIYDGRVNGSQIPANQIVANHIQAGAITAGKIQAGTITANEIATNAINANHIQSGAITAGKISVTNLAAIKADLGTITAGTITGVTINGVTINGVTINGGTIRGGRYYNTGGTAYMEIGSSSYGDLTLNNGSGSRVFQVYDDGSGSLGLRAYGTRFLTSRGSGTSAIGSWDFSGASVTGLNTSAKFA